MNTPFSPAFEALTSADLVTLAGGYNSFSSFQFDELYPIYPVILPIREPYNIDLM